LKIRGRGQARPEGLKPEAGKAESRKWGSWKRAASPLPTS